MITPYIRYIDLTDHAREIVKSGSYLYYAKINFSNAANEYFSPKMFFRDPETGRIDLPPDKLLAIKKKISFESIDYAKKIYDELRIVAPGGRLKALAWAKHSGFFKNNECYMAFRESEEYVFETRIYFCDEAVARIYCYSKGE